ncbi:hypothetical protein VB715_19045 [Crocosphaera sp. UHCC 0190]|uniref:hypothetical protein n=1 Tax=Crocosphaera sp. UHCC 0190 TaxID=3110246 RepID=UPI002B1F8CD8|nr:hypothetical protein [Crocosphaera sp. UHCC 0190]MEA5511873.1 hypothetical protein [Crocosphaera sp. UHCC 0190]
MTVPRLIESGNVAGYNCFADSPSASSIGLPAPEKLDSHCQDSTNLWKKRP